jgi:hypothetical protein
VIAVRDAEPADADAMSAVLMASITVLCAADHRHDPDVLAMWLANKTPPAVRDMLANPQGRLLVAEHGGKVAAVGAYAGREIRLNYVDPGHRFAGLSKALLGFMEGEIGRGEAVLTSTQTARRFYQAQGWRETGSIERFGPMACYPMRKLIPA